VTVHEFVQMPVGWSAAYVADWVVFAVYGLYVLGAAVLSAPYRARIHRGNWLHIAEGWAIVAVVWAACGWAKYVLAAGDRDWSGAGPIPRSIRLTAIILFALQPALYLLPLIMAITTAVRLWRVAPAAPVEAAGTR
jgi:hypothetical protein